jgi:hypothetical protein
MLRRKNPMESTLRNPPLVAATGVFWGLSYFFRPRLRATVKS